MESDTSHQCIVGTKQVLRYAETGLLISVYLADDADAFIKEKIIAACEKNQIEIRHVTSMKLLGEAFHIDVGAACAGLTKDGTAG